MFLVVPFYFFYSYVQGCIAPHIQQDPMLLHRELNVYCLFKNVVLISKAYYFHTEGRVIINSNSNCVYPTYKIWYLTYKTRAFDLQNMCNVNSINKLLTSNLTNIYIRPRTYKFVFNQFISKKGSNT